MVSSGTAMGYRRDGDRYGGGGVSAGNRGNATAPALELRASVLEAAISLGFRNSVMKKWMEGDDDDLAEHGTPALTSPSTTSEESALSPASFLHPASTTSASTYPSSSSRTNGHNPSGVGVVDPKASFPGTDMGMRFSHDDDMASTSGSQKGPFGMFALAVPPPKNKLRKQNGAYPGISVPFADGTSTNEYESDSGYVSEVSRKPKTKKSLAWRWNDGDGEDSDAGYRSEAVSGSAVAKARTKRKAKEKEKGKEDERIYIPRVRDTPSPMLPPMSLDNDPGALLATIKASVLPDSTSSGGTVPLASGSGSRLGNRTPEPPRPPVTRAFTSLSDHGHGSVRSKLTDGYLTDSGSSEKRGRSKKKGKSSAKSSDKSRPGSPDVDGAHRDGRTPTKKKSLFRLLGRSVSREAKDRSRTSEEVPPVPKPPHPPMPLPIAEKFARSGASTPVGNASASLSSTQGSGFKYTDAQQPMLRPSGSLTTLVPPTLRDPTISRSESPWSYNSAPGRIGTSAETADAVRGGGSGSNSNSNSLELPRERRNSAGWSPFVVIPRDRTDSEMNTDEANGGVGSRGQREAGRAGSPTPGRSVSPTTTTNGSQITRSPTKRIGKLFNAFGQSSKSDDGHSNDSHITSGSSSNGTAPPTSFSSSSKPAISGPNPHLRRSSLSLKFPSPMEIAAALTSSARGVMNGNGGNGSNSGMGAANVVDGNAKNLTVGGEAIRPKTPESFIIIDEDEGVPTPMRQQRFAEASANASDPPAVGNPPSPTRPNATSSGLSARRRALLNGLGIDTTPTQSRSGTPTPINTNLNASPIDGIPNEGEARAARASVLAYYNVPPPSPPPTGPLPAPPPQLGSSSPSSGMRPISPVQEVGGNRQTLLSPGRAFASRSPSPLGLSPIPDNRYSRSPSPLGIGQGVKRGRESPFPTRPILPPQNRQELVERVERYKALYAAAEGTGSDENAGKEREEVLDRHSSAYILQARARGEKRVYFDPKHYSIENAYYYGDEITEDGEGEGYAYRGGFEYGDEFPRDVSPDDADDVDPVIPNINIHPEPEVEKDGLIYGDDFDEEADERLRYSQRLSTRDEFEDVEPSASTDNLNASATKGKEKDVESLGDEASSTDRRSFAASSVYSEYSVLDADRSAKFREGLVRRVAALYNGGSGKKDEGRLLKEEIPEVPKVPKEFRNFSSSNVAAGQLRSELKATSSPYRF